MEKQTSDHSQLTNISHAEPDPPEPVRTRWTPKPEQILILESIFNSGMVNPPKEETVRIRKLLEKFGAVRDANVFYWFQNRRSRSRRRQRQQQASTGPQRISGCNSLFLGTSPNSCSSGGIGSRSSYYSYNTNVASNAIAAPAGGVLCSSSANYMNPSILKDEAGDDLFAISRQFGLLESDHSANSACSSNMPQLHYQSCGTMTVFINGTALEVPRGPLDMRSMFGHDAVLVHSSGELLPVNEYGVLMKGLQLGESYFLVSRSV
ncbi:WUSCHEL-related homeobox [Rhynchospora pubera]|uniref:WUSCHEL-related homeobox n=1 Tax=Rhynchospora pubera TaxID=906938 RepID=A0AAV8F2J2_9POAL|nr:WUSCHEL-related homeobox [Rhynchospora pubera]